MRFNKKICLSLICLLAFLICSLSGCIWFNDDSDEDYDIVFDNKYNAKLIGMGETHSADDWFTEEFWTESQARYEEYVNEKYSPNDQNNEEENSETVAPQFLSAYIISNQQEFDETFAEDCFSDYRELNYDKSMLVVTVYRGFYNNRTELKSVEVQDKHLTIECVKIPKKENSFTHYHNTTGRLWVWIVVVMDKLDVDTAEITVRNL